MTIQSMQFGKWEIELYRYRFLTVQEIRKLLKKYEEWVKLVAVSAFLTIIPAVGMPVETHRFPDTTNRVVFNKTHTPLALPAKQVAIAVGESNAQRKEREAREAKTNASKKTRTPALHVTLAKANQPGCPESFRPFYQEVGPRFGVPWQVIEAIHQVESGKSCHTNRRSYAGAVGPMQFLPSTWRKYQWDCTNDGVADITNAYDAICTGAHYIGTGMTGFTLERSIYSYNHSWSYVNKVMSIAREIGYEG